MIPLRYLAEVNPQTPEFDAVAADAAVTFLPLETVWADGRADQGRSVPKSAVAFGYTRFRPGDVVCPKVTPTFQAGRSMIAEALGAGTTELHILRPRQDVDPRWVCYAVRSKHFLDEGVTAFQGVAGLQRVPPEYVASFRVADLGVDEQRRIADFLDDRVTLIDQIITARQQQSTAVRALAHASLSALLDEAGAKYGFAPLRRFCGGIEQGASPVADDRPAGPGEAGVLKTSAIQAGVFRAHHNKVIPADAVEQRYQIRSGDVLVTRGSGSADLVGDSAVAEVENDRPLYLSDLTYRLRRLELDAVFASLSITSARGRAELGARVRQGSGPAKARGEDILSIPVPAAPIDTQRAIAERAIRQRADTGERLQHLDHSVARLTEYKQSLITAAVSGELDVSTAGSGIPGLGGGEAR